VLRKLDIGAGHNPYQPNNPEWEHFDKRAMPHIEHVGDQRSLPFDDSTFDVIRSAHTIEHEWWTETDAMLQEWRRVLKPGGYAEIRCPNILYVAQDIASRPERLKDWVPLIHGSPYFPGWGETDLNSHRMSFSPQTLIDTCLSAGFSSVESLADGAVECCARAWNGQAERYPILIPPTQKDLTRRDYKGKKVFIVDHCGMGDIIDTCGIIHRLRGVGAGPIVLCSRVDIDNSIWRDSLEIDFLCTGKLIQPGCVLLDDYAALIEYESADVVLNLCHPGTKANRDADYVRQKADWIGLDWDVPRPHVEVGVHVPAHTEGLLKDAGLKKGEYIAVHFQAGDSIRTLPDEDIKEFLERYEGKVVVLGLAAPVFGGDNVYDFSQGVPADAAAQLIEWSKGVVCVDSSMAHVAWAFDKPMIGLFHSNWDYALPKANHRRIHTAHALEDFDASRLAEIAMEMFDDYYWTDSLQYAPDASPQSGNSETIDFILGEIGETNCYFVDLGASDGDNYSNTRHLKERGWDGLMVDKNPQGNGAVLRHHITKDNICGFLSLEGAPGAFDVLSIDIDGNDYWVLREVLLSFRPRLIIAEFNAHQAHGLSKAIAYNADHEYTRDDYFGFTFDAGVKLAAEFGYAVVGISAIDMFLVDASLVDKSKIKPIRPYIQQPCTHKDGEWIEI